MPSLEHAVEELNGKTVIVEGKKDVMALHDLGIETVIPINSRPLIDVVRSLEEAEEVVVLTDFDREGRKLHARLMPLLQRHRIRVNRRLRHMMRELGKTRIEDFNGIAGAIKEGDIHGKTRANINKVHYQSAHHSQGRYRKA